MNPVKTFKIFPVPIFECQIDKHEKINDPIAPEIVFFGLIFVNFGPFNIFPKINPPMSELTQHINKEKIIIFNCIK